MENRFCLQMVSCGEGCCSNGNGGTAVENVYSTEETVCGTWIDGKPIYRKVIPGKLADKSGNALVFANVSDLKIDKLINLHGNMIDKNSINQITFPVTYNVSSGLEYAVNTYYNIETGNILYHFINSFGAYSGCTAYVVIEYTKK